MIRNYLKTAIRSLFRNKLYTLLNVAGLTFGLCCFLLIGLYLFDELTFDRSHRNAGRIYRVVEQKTVNGEATRVAGAGYKLAEESRRSIPGVETTTRIQRIGRANLSSVENPSTFFQETITVADEQLLSVFDFPFMEGDPESALREPHSILITETLAKRLFNKTDVIGKALVFSFAETPLKITGVLKDHPRNSSFDFSSVMSESSFQQDPNFKEGAANDWFSNNYLVFALLRPGADPQSVSDGMTRLVKANFEAPAGTSYSFSLQPLKDVHLHSEDIVDGARNANVEAQAKGNITYIRVFSFVALFLLLIAGINYMNLTTARASGRLKEIGVRKTIGALRKDLVRQFLLESLLLTMLAFVLALGLVNLALPSFNAFTGKELSLGLSTDFRVWMYAFGFALLTGLLSGSYPALMLSRFKPVLLLKGVRLPNRSDLSLRKGLVVFQFTISVLMIIGTLVLFLQVQFLNNSQLGFNKDLLVVIDVNTGTARDNFESVKAEMAKISSVKQVSVTSRVPGEWKSLRTIRVKPSGSGEEARISYMIGVDPNFFATFEVGLVKGRNFSTPADSGSIIINETAARMLKITEPAGQMVEIPSFSRTGNGNFVPVGGEGQPFRPRVIGIVKDFHFQSLRDKIEPLVLCYHKNPIHGIDYYTARIEPHDIRGTLDQLKEVMVKYDKDEPFEYHFLNDQLALFYIEDARRQTILIWAALATIFIACLGLFGLATYSAEQRIKEIGVRKVLGATVLSLSALLSKDFLKLVILANIIAFPIAWWATHRWLQEYAYHIELEWWIFVLAAAAACLIALITVSYQAIRAAMANPVKSLRTE